MTSPGFTHIRRARASRLDQARVRAQRRRLALESAALQSNPRNLLLNRKQLLAQLEVAGETGSTVEMIGNVPEREGHESRPQPPHNPRTLDIPAHAARSQYRSPPTPQQFFAIPDGPDQSARFSRRIAFRKTRPNFVGITAIGQPSALASSPETSEPEP